jgi:hypothetical protein
VVLFAFLHESFGPHARWVPFNPDPATYVDVSEVLILAQIVNVDKDLLSWARILRRYLVPEATSVVHDLAVAARHLRTKRIHFTLQKASPVVSGV